MALPFLESSGQSFSFVLVANSQQPSAPAVYPRYGLRCSQTNSTACSSSSRRSRGKLAAMTGCCSQVFYPNIAYSSLTFSTVRTGPVTSQRPLILSPNSMLAGCSRLGVLYYYFAQNSDLASRSRTKGLLFSDDLARPGEASPTTTTTTTTTTTSHAIAEPPPNCASDEAPHCCPTWASLCLRQRAGMHGRIGHLVLGCAHRSNHKSATPSWFISLLRGKTHDAPSHQRSPSPCMSAHRNYAPSAVPRRTY